MTGAPDPSVLESETLREALLVQNELREREAAALRASNALRAGLEAMTSAPSPAEAISALLASIRGAFACDSVAVLKAEEANLEVAHLEGSPAPPRLPDAAEILLSKARLVVDLRACPWWPNPLGPAGALRSWLSAPAPMSAGSGAVLICGSLSQSAFSHADRDVLTRLGRLAAQALNTHDLSERNRRLAAVIEGSTARFARADAERERLLRVRAVAMDNTEDAIAITDQEGCFTYMNPAHLSLFGFTAEAEVIGRPWSILYESDAVAMLEADAMPELQRNGSWRGEVKGRTTLGAPVMQEVSLTLLEDVGLICVTRDISSRLRSEAERARLRERLHEAQRREALGLFAAGVAHDVNNVLAAISGSAALIQGAAETPGDAHVRRILDASDHARELVSRLTLLGRKRETAAPTELRALLAAASDLLVSALPHNVALVVDSPDADLVAPLDPTDFLQVVSNLAINARDALSDAGGDIRVRLRRRSSAAIAAGAGCRPVIGALSPDQDYAELTVSDNGVGMSADQFATIFEPYVTTKGADGTGLGLSIVAHIVRSAHGALIVESEDGRGSSFHVCWPLGPPPSTARSIDTVDSDLSSKLVLIVDDDPEAAAEIGRALEAAGAEIAIASHPRDALEAITEDPQAWSVLVTDLEMPSMTGEGLARATRRLRPDLPVILFTGRPNTFDPSALFDAVVLKTEGPDALVAAVAASSTPAGEAKEDSECQEF